MKFIRTLAAVSLVSALATPSAFAACKDEVLAALDKQRKAPAFRMESSMINERGPVKMVVEFVPPDRMRQTVTAAVDPKPTETLVISGKAWVKDDGAWKELSSETAGQLVSQIDEIFGDDPGTIGTVGCLGSTAIDGQELMAYRIENDAQTGPVDRSPGAKEKAAAALTDENRAVRMFYVDAKSGLPVRSLFARANKLDKPIFTATYTYPTGLAIDPPQ